VTEKLQTLDARLSRQTTVTDLGMPAFTRIQAAAGPGTGTSRKDGTS
jgi:hypothetical protein